MIKGVTCARCMLEMRLQYRKPMCNDCASYNTKDCLYQNKNYYCEKCKIEISIALSIGPLSISRRIR